jgi:bifunctional NMN adenylyltransferase/nudix hydrolase
MEHNYCVFIGRFQPFHLSHLQVVKEGLTQAKELIIVLGSAHSARNIKNPWTTQEREEMIRRCLTNEENSRTHFVNVRDYFYNDNLWVADIQAKINSITEGDPTVALIGTYKDSSSYYIKLFPQWEFLPSKSNGVLNATDARNALFDDVSLPSNQAIIANMLPIPVQEYLTEWIDNKAYVDLVAEYKFIKDYKKAWSVAPYPVTFNTVDCVVIQSGHVLVVKRKFNPGKGLIALPGGFVKENETLETSAIRELKEETGIRVEKIVLKNHVVDNKTFDHPGRSLRGRTITHAFCIRLPDGELPEVKGGDDAAKAYWMPLMDVARLEHEFYEDHAHIINYFIKKF